MAEIIDFIQKKNEILDKKRRKFDRFVFNHFLRLDLIHSELKSLRLSCEVKDISLGGMLLEASRDSSFKIGDELSLKLYLSSHFYVELEGKIVRRESLVTASEQKERIGIELFSHKKHYEVYEKFFAFLNSFHQVSKEMI